MVKSFAWLVLDQENMEEEAYEDLMGQEHETQWLDHMLNLASEKEIQTNEKINTFEKCRRIDTSFYKYLAMKPNISKYMPSSVAFLTMMLV